MNENKNNNIFFRTDNLSLASTLRYFNFKVSNISRPTNSRHVVFEFEDNNQLKELVREFWSEALVVEPQKFASVLKSTKSFVYDHSYMSEKGDIQNV